MSITVARLLELSQAELDDLFRASPSGEIPDGEGEGTAIVAPDLDLSDLAVGLINLFAWQGKEFDRARGVLRNTILPIGLKAIVATIYREASWFDGQECIVLDYSKTSLIAQHVRDEMRQVAPGLYLGIVYWDRLKALNFALAFPTAATGADEGVGQPAPPAPDEPGA